LHIPPTSVGAIPTSALPLSLHEALFRFSALPINVLLQVLGAQWHHLQGKFPAAATVGAKTFST